jgi:hypothetical protein
MPVPASRRSAPKPASKPDKRRRPSYSEPVPIPSPEPPDISVQQAMWYGDWSPRQVFRLISPPEDDPSKPPLVESFLFGGKRRIILASLKQYRADCIAAGHRLSLRPTIGTRPPGRPKKHKTSPAG